ncbi:MAG: plasmid mobilization protein [Lachnospirales bacterium]
MSRKVYDKKNRHRNKTISFHMSPQENEQLNKFVSLSGLTKQDYLIKRTLQEYVVINGNPRVFKAFKNQLNDIILELHRISILNTNNDDLLELISFTTKVLEELTIENDQ